MRLVVVTQQPFIVKLHRCLVVGIPYGIGRMSIAFLSFGAIRGNLESRRKVKYAISKDKDDALTISKPSKEIKFKKGIAE